MSETEELRASVDALAARVRDLADQLDGTQEHRAMLAPEPPATGPEATEKGENDRDE